MSIFNTCLDYYCKDKFDSITDAGMSFNIDASINQIDIDCSGFNEKLHLLLNQLTKNVRNFNNFSDEISFERAKNKKKVSLSDNLKSYRGIAG